MAVTILVIAFAVLALSAAVDCIRNFLESRKQPSERRVNLNIHTDKKEPEKEHIYLITMQWYNSKDGFSKMVVAHNPMEAVNAVTDKDMNKTYWVVKVEQL